MTRAQIFLKSILWGLATLIVSLPLFNIKTFFQQSRVTEAIFLSIAVFLIALTVNFFKYNSHSGADAKNKKYFINVKNQFLVLLLAVFSFLITWYIFIGQSWETEKLEKIVSVIFTWPFVALIFISLFYPVIKSHLDKFFSEFAEGRFNLRLGEFELNARELDVAVEEAAEEARNEVFNTDDPATHESSENLSEYPDTLIPIADRAKREAIIEILPEAFLVFLFGQTEKILRILFYVYIQTPPTNRMRRHNINYITKRLFYENYIDEKFYKIFGRVIKIRNTIAHGGQLDEQYKDELKQICAYLSDYIVKEYREQQDLFNEYWHVDVY